MKFSYSILLSTLAIIVIFAKEAPPTPQQHATTAHDDLLQAIENNNPEQVQQALAAGADVNAPHESRTPLMTASLSGFKKELIPKDMPSCIHCCETHNGSWRKEYDALLATTRRRIMQMLLEAGTDATAQDYQGRTALHLACTINNDPEKVRLLINAGVALDAQDHNGKTALMEAVVDGSYEVVELLLAAGALPA